MRGRIILLLLFISFSLFSQTKEVGIGQWRVHYSYFSALSVTQAEGKIYCASPLSFYSIDEDGQFTTLSKIDGFSSVGIGKIKYSEALKLLLVTYNDGNIDILKSDSIININDIARKSIVGSKNVNHIEFNGRFAYLSYDFGLVVLDCIKREVKETYNNLSPLGNVTKVFGSTLLHDTLFLATDRGIMAARNSVNLNLQDFNSWYTFTSPVASEPSAVTNLNGGILVSYGKVGIFNLKNGAWSQVLFSVDISSLGDDVLTFLSKSNGKVIAGFYKFIYQIQDDLSTSLLTGTAERGIEAIFDNNGFLWVADFYKGLITNKFSSQENLIPYRPNGPYASFAFNLSYFNNKIVGVPGGYGPGGRTSAAGGFFVLENNEWKNFNILYKFPEVAVLDLVNSQYNPFTNKFYLSSFSSGLIEIKPDSSYTLYDTVNSTLTPTFGNSPFVVDTDIDSKGRLWAINTLDLVPTSLPSLHVLNKDGSWGKPIVLNYSIAKFLCQIAIDDNDYIWLRSMPGNSEGILVYDYEKDRRRFLTTAKGNGELPSMKIQCMTKDKKGQMWIGTDAGIAIFYQPYTVFNNSNYDAGRPIVDGHPLLFDQLITCIKVDGGNRKWVGTSNGVWLFNEDGTAPILNFTVENSPLLSNNIRDIQINDMNGEVFFSTDQGIISYKGTATESSATTGGINVFPNPVLPTFTGTIGITGLAANSTVKITDVFGNLVYETKSQGGMATWNARNYNGKTAKSGLYLIFSADDTGSETLISKIAILD